MGVFFPSLMGVGILISGALLISDWVRRLFPKGNVRRQHNVIVGTYGVVGDAIDAAGYHLEEPWFINRWLRRRRTYLAVTLIAVVAGLGSIWAGHRFFDDPLGLFYRSPWAIGIGYGVAAALFLIALLCLTVLLVYESPPRPIAYLLRETILGRIVLPTVDEHDEAIHHVEKET